MLKHVDPPFNYGEHSLPSDLRNIEEGLSGQEGFAFPSAPRLIRRPVLRA
jgi:hypothetical protein